MNILSDTHTVSHNAQLTFNITIPDGVYVPEEFQFSEDDIKMAYNHHPVNGDSVIVAVEVHDYIVSILTGLGIDVRLSGIADNYRVEN